MSPARPAADALRVVVVDDEPHARADLLQQLTGMRGVSIVGDCSTGAQALAAVRQRRPDVLLLDIRMPGLDGLKVVEQLSEPQPYVVFVTAYDRYAIEAFRVRALDYVLKPVQPARLGEALARAREQRSLRATAAQAQALLAAAASESRGAPPRRRFWAELTVRVGRRDVLLRTDEIDWVEADTYYARLHARGRSFLLRERMHVLEARLDPRCFTRVHRSAIVNLSRVREIERPRRGERVLVLSTGARVRASQRRWQAFRATMRARNA